MQTHAAHVLRTLACCALVACSASANASLVGSTIAANGPSLAPATATIGTGPEFHLYDHIWFDFDASTLTIYDTSTTGTAWRNFVFFSFSGFDEVISGMRLKSNSGFSGTLLSNYSFTPDSITVHMQDGESLAGSSLVFEIDSATSQRLPEPSTAALIALAGLASIRRTRRRTDAA